MIGKFSNFSGPLSSLISSQPNTGLSLILSLDSGLTSSFSLSTGSLEFFSSRYLLCASNDFKFGTNDFTVELWFYKYSGSPDTFGLINNYYTPNDIGFRIYINASNTLTGLINESSNFGFIEHPITVTDDTWHHVAMVRQGGTFSMYLDGQEFTIAAGVANLNDTQNANLYVGRSFVNIDGQYFNGLITNVRVSNSAIYTESFTVSTEQLQSNGSTLLLLLALDESSVNVDSNTDLSPKLLFNQNVFFNALTPITKNFTYTKIWKDTSGNSRDFHFIDSPILVNEFGNSLYITDGNYATGSDLGNLSRYTLDIWTNIKTAVPGSSFFTNIWDANPHHINMFIGNFWAGNLGVWGGSYDGASNFKTILDNFDADTDRWYNFVLTFDKDSNVTMYINGETYSTNNVSPYVPQSSGLGYLIGKKWADDQYPVPTIDANVSIINVWNGALTHSTINSNYNNLLDRFYFTFHLDNYDNWDASASVIYDLKSNLPGTVSGVSYDASNGGCLLFGETASINFGNPEPVNQNGDLSIFSWVKFNNFNTAYNVIVDHFGPSPNDIFFTVKPDDTYTNWYMNLYTQFDYGVPGNLYGGLYDTTSLELNTWYHLGFTLQNGGDLTFYVNGMTSSVFTSVNRNNCNLDFIVGSSDINNGLRGYLGELKLYNRVLSDNEVFSLYDSNYLRYNPPYGSMTLDNILESHLLSTSLDYVIGADDFTIESWFKLNNAIGYSGIFSTRNLSSQKGVSINISTGSPANLEFYIGETSITDISEYTVQTDRWYHAAITRISGTTSYFLDGSKIKELSDSNNYQNSTLAIGRYYNDYNGYFLNGLISQSRLIIGTAIYTSDFVVSATVSDVAGTVFLINKGYYTFVDESPYQHNIENTNIGFTQSLPIPITSSQSSILFNGTTDWLELSGSNDWALSTTYTIEFWSKSATNSNGNLFTIISQGDSDTSIDIYYQNGNLFCRNGQIIGTEPTPGVWTHVAIVSDSSTIRLYYNGVDQSISANGGNLVSSSGIAIGRRSPSYNFQYFKGSLYGIRIVKGVAVYNTNFDPYSVALPSTFVSGTVLILNKFIDGEFIDSTYRRIITNHGLQYNSNLPFRPGGSIELGNGTQRYFALSGSSDWAVGTGDFCVEWFQYQLNDGPPNYPRVFSVGSYPNESIGVSIESGYFLGWLNGGTSFYGGFSLADYLNKWTHLAYVRQSGILSIYQNGSKIWSQAVYNDVNNSTDSLFIGFGTNNEWNGYLTNFRFVKGNYVYTGSSFTVPTKPLTSVTGTKLLLNSFSSETYDIDSSGLGKNITNVNGVTWSSNSPFV